MGKIIMIQATISQVKNRLSAYLRRVKAGETVVIMDRKTPVASLAPIPAAEDMDPRLERLIGAGVVERGEVSATVAREPDIVPVRLAIDVDVVASVIEERRSGR